MNLADHLRPLLRDHDCVIIPDFGGLVAEYTPAQVRPGGRHLLLPPTRQVAFNQALTRNDGLLVDALREHLHLPAADAREAVRQAVANLHQQLRTEQHTELPGIGVFRQLPGRGLQFEYTGTDCLLPTAFGLPELAAHPVRVLDARQAREQQAQLVPRLRAAGKGQTWRRVRPAAAVGLLAGVAVAALYLLGLHPEAAPVGVRPYLARFTSFTSHPAPQQATLGQATFAPVPTLRPTANAEPTRELTAAPEEATAAPKKAAVMPAAVPATSAAAAPAAKVVAAPVAARPIVVAAPPAQTTPAPSHQTPNAAEALLDHPARAPKGKVPATAAVALATSDNVAHPVPLASRRANTPGLTTKYPIAPATAAGKLIPAKGLLVMPTTPSKPVASAPAAKPTPATPAAKPAALLAKPAVAAPVTKPAVAPVASAATAAAASTIKQPTGRFYLVVGAFGDMTHAQRGRAILAHTGRPAKIILPHAGTRKFRITAGDFADQASANVVAARLRQNPNFKQGVTVYPY